MQIIFTKKFFKTMKPRGFFFSSKDSSLAVKLSRSGETVKTSSVSSLTSTHPLTYFFTLLHDCFQVGKRTIQGKNPTLSFNGLTPQRDVTLDSSEHELSRKSKPMNPHSIRNMNSSCSHFLNQLGLIKLLSLTDFSSSGLLTSI